MNVAGHLLPGEWQPVLEMPTWHLHQHKPLLASIDMPANLVADPDWEVSGQRVSWNAEAGLQYWEYLVAAIKAVSSMVIVLSWNS